MNQTECPIDLEYLQQLSDGDLEFEQELLQVYIEDGGQHLQAAKTAIADRDQANLAREAHHLKGASGNVGAIEMQSLAQQLEEKGKILDWHSTNNLSADLEAGLERISKFITSHYAT
jgi:histidine phosphotransfer protein HptB